MPRLDDARGVYIISVTPFTDTGGLDLESTDRLVDFYLESGVTGITVLGMMGEAPKLTADESRTFARHVMKRVRNRVAVVVGVSSPGFAVMGALAAGVMADGAAGVMVAPPATVRTDGQILDYFAGVAETLGSNPWVLQDFPLATGVQMSPSVIAALIQTIPTCLMLKHEDWPGLNKITTLRESMAKGDTRRISILVGNGGVFLPEELARGADGAMTGFAYPEMMVEVCRLFEAGQIEHATDLFDAYLPLVRYEQQPEAGLAVRKHVLAKRGIIASSVLRKPGKVLTGLDIGEVERLMARQARRLAEIA